jgi:large subunit ribosomal protein L23
MAFKLFGKNKKTKTQAAPEKEQAVLVEPKATGRSMNTGAYPALRGLYVSEKSSQLGLLNQFVFEVAPNANKSEIRKQITKLYDVKVTDVKVMNIPGKRRDIGRHPGFRPGIRKAIVTLPKGQTIEQAKP